MADGRQQLDIEYDSLEARDSGLLPGDNALKSVAHLAQQAAYWTDRVAQLEDELRKAKAEMRKYTDGLLPDAMVQVGLSSFTLADGRVAQTKPIVEISVKDQKTEEAMQWLVEHGHGGIIKSYVAVALDKGDEQRVREIVTFLEQHGLKPEVNNTVHPMTLKKFYRELVENGDDVPPDLFGTYRANRTVLVDPNKPRSRRK